MTGPDQNFEKIFEIADLSTVTSYDLSRSLPMEIGPKTTVTSYDKPLINYL
jgi:hypothetical protein